MHRIIAAGSLGLLVGCAAPVAEKQSVESSKRAVSSPTPIARIVKPAEPQIDPVPVGTVCHETDSKRFKGRSPAAIEDENLGGDKPLIAGGKIVCRIDPKVTQPGSYELVRHEMGSYRGVLYRIFYTDGSGTVQGDPASTLDYMKDMRLKNWSLQCKADQIDDTRWCSISKEDLTVGIWKDGSTFVWVGSDHYPSSKITVRIDKHPPISANERSGFGGAQAKMIVGQLKAGGSVVTRYQEWPYQANVDKKTSLFGFDEAWSLLGLVYKNASTK